MKPRDIVIAVLLMLNLTYLVVRDDVALAAQARKPAKRVAFQSASERSLPLLREIRDSLHSIDGKMDVLIALQQNAAKKKP